MTKNTAFTLIWFVALAVIGMSHEPAYGEVRMVSLDGRQIGDGTAGPVTVRLRQLYKNLIEQAVT